MNSMIINFSIFKKVNINYGLVWAVVFGGLGFYGFWDNLSGFRFELSVLNNLLKGSYLLRVICVKGASSSKWNQFWLLHVTSQETNGRIQNFMRFLVILTTASAGLRAFRRPEKPEKLEPARLGFWPSNPTRKPKSQANPDQTIWGSISPQCILIMSRIRGCSFISD